MTYFKSDYGHLIQGDVLQKIDLIESNTVQSIITSPPYYGLRDYQHHDQIGQEETYQEYIEKLVAIFRKSKRILKDDGLLFINIADSYAGTRSKNNKETDPKNSKGRVGMKSISENIPGIERKSLIGIPQRLQIAMIDDGWICRNVIIWQKPNAMPESVKDRFTIDFEYIFMFSKRSKYKFNQLKEPMVTKDRYQAQKGLSIANKHSSLVAIRGSKGTMGTLNQGSRKEYSQADYDRFKDKYQNDEDFVRNKRTVWSISTKGTKEAHFATFPEELVENLILCSTDVGDITCDLFMGSGTVSKVAEVNNRKWIGIELNEEYCELIKQRVAMVQPKLTL